MKLLHPVSLALGLTLTSASYGEQFAIDPSQSYVEVNIPYWVRDEPSPAYFNAQPRETLIYPRRSDRCGPGPETMRSGPQRW